MKQRLLHIVGSYGDRIVPPTKIPTKEGTEMFNYIFDGWNVPVPDELTENHRFVAVFKEVMKTFNVVFLDGNGNVFDVQVVDYGTSANEPLGILSKTQLCINTNLQVGIFHMIMLQKI